jgi:hypothetical protein
MKRYILLLILCFALGFAHSQNDSIITYQCDFEDSNERDMWMRNAGPNGPKCANQWYFGKLGSNGGDYGLFVSKDGTSNNYEASGLTVVAYRELNALKAGEYEFSFDWRAAGWQDSISDIDGLYVFWLPASESTNSVSNSTVPKWFDESKALKFGRKSPKLSQSDWNTVVGTITTDGTPHKLVFVWRNGINGAYPPAACVDNILIMPEGYCNKPYDLSLVVNDLDATFSWKGDAAAYDVRCYNSRTARWKEYQNVQDTFVVVEGVEEGMCTYYVRARCEGISGTWVSLSQFIYYPGARCIDFLSLSTENCFTGPNPNNSDGSGQGVGFTASLVDMGYQSMESRHTVHYDINERDPRTNGGLRTVPEGEVASVRLGNWNTGGEAERVEYKYTVDASTSAILILKYAVVLQDPEHNEIWQPKFELEVLKNGKPISNKGCGEAKFTAGANTSEKDGWHKFDTGWWKDWTTISINLREHHGEEVVVRLTTYDCAELGHFGYAYFTLNCSDGELKSTACGDVENDTLIGPEGFKYRWYKKSDATQTLSADQSYIISTKDTATYCLDVIQPTRTECYYTLETSGLQRYPVADGEYRPYVEECMNKVAFTNKSYVSKKDALGNNVNSGEDCDVVWVFGDGSTSSNFNPVHVYPATGGKFTATLKASIGGGKCEEIKTFEFELPNVTDMRDTIRTTICPGETYKLGDVTYDSTGVYADTIPTEYGCDNITVLYLTVLKDTTIYDTICSTDVLFIDGVQVTKTGKYSEKSVLGCDSIIWDIIVNESLVLGIDSVVSVCASDDNLVIPFVEESGKLLQFDINFTDEAMADVSAQGLSPENGAMVISMAEGVKPNRYKATLSFGELACGGDDIELFVDVYYPESVIAQRWNDVLAVRNSEYNGGYDFVAYQWYKNNEPIVGATSSILYQDLDFDAEYAVLLTREDGVKEMTCALKPMRFDDSKESIVIFSSNSSSQVMVKAPESAKVRIWTTMGVLVAEYPINKGENAFDLDRQVGVYLLEFIFEDATRVVERIVF